ncbi:MAG: hypothetical protein HY542_01315, partial [Deltaproteobacteria bacterium]|nr:hypothetical protein [Deltaproteobacteria bacterium]
MHRFTLPLLFLSLFSCAKTGYIYRSPNRIDFVRLAKAKGDEGQGLKHPYRLAPAQIREALRSVRFSKKALIMKAVTDEHLFEERHVEFLAPYLIEAFQKATPSLVVVASYFTQRHQWG